MNLLPKPQSWLAAMALAISPAAAQAQNEPPPGTAAVAPATSDEAAGSQIVRMSQFEVATTQGHGYVSPNAAEAFKTSDSLMNIPQTDVVITNDFIHDIGTGQTLDDVINYFGGKESFQGDGNVSLRGGTSSSIYIDEFPYHAGWRDSAVVDSVELIQGGAEGLYMLNSGIGGIIMQTEKNPLPYRMTEVGVSSDQWGTWRADLDSTGPIGKLGDVDLSYRLVAVYQKSHSYFTNWVDDRHVLYPYFQAKYHNTTIRFHVDDENFFGIETGAQIITPTGELWTGNGRRTSEPPATAQRLWTDLYEGNILQKISDSWEMRLSGQYLNQGTKGAWDQATAYNWAQKAEYFTNELYKQRWQYWTALSDITGHYNLGPDSWSMKNTDIVGWAFTDQVVEKYIVQATTYHFSDSSQGLTLLPGEAATARAVSLYDANGINTMPVPPISSYPQGMSAGSHTTTWIGGFYYQHTASVIPNWLDLTGGVSYLNLITDVVSNSAVLPWTPTENHTSAWVHRFAALVHLGKEVSIYALSATNASPPTSAIFFITGPGTYVATGVDNEVGIKTAFLGGRLSADAAYFKETTKNVAVTAGVFPNGITYNVLAGFTVQEGVSGDIAFSLTPGWQIVGSFFAGHDRDQNNNPVTGCFDNSLGIFSRYRFDKASFLHGFSFGAGMNRIGGRWMNSSGITGGTYLPTTLANGGQIKVQTGTMTNAFVSYALNRHWNFLVSCQNVLDQTYPLAVQTAYEVMASPPRTTTFRIEYTF